MTTRRSTNWACALLAVGAVIAGTGCDGLDAALTFSVDVAQSTAATAIQDAIRDIVVDVIPGTDAT